MAIAIALVLLVIGTVAFHFLESLVVHADRVQLGDRWTTPSTSRSGSPEPCSSP